MKDSLCAVNSLLFLCVCGFFGGFVVVFFYLVILTENYELSQQ